MFALYMADCGRKLELSTEGFKIGNMIVSGLLFADDLLVCSPKFDGLVRLLRVCRAEAKARGV